MYAHLNTKGFMPVPNGHTQMLGEKPAIIASIVHFSLSILRPSLMDTVCLCYCILFFSRPAATLIKKLLSNETLADRHIKYVALILKTALHTLFPPNSQQCFLLTMTTIVP